MSEALIPQTLLEVCNLACERDGRTLFAGVDFALVAGAALQIQGANGTGKTTLLRTLTGSAGGYRGEIRWRGRSLPGGLPALRESLLYIGHREGVRRGLTPLENLSWYGADTAAAYRALQQLGLQGFEDSLCQRLSAGQNRRVALARLYLPQPPRLWILDEPLAALDADGVASLEARMARHLAGGGIVLFTSHQPVALDGIQTVDLADFAPAGDFVEGAYAFG
ncbi:cytochrome c biogenesis heme-transporting ATPase CcmA [Microbulbifer discodermiae]|uniref:cytochrome c biogenesis heme-transporting ATPase CcmA n=1 Tax=Microbulbifer sp. 2201CG32-9 TaxID=3232309 RepID=UPI00345BB4E7